MSVNYYDPNQFIDFRQQGGGPGGFPGGFPGGGFPPSGPPPFGGGDQYGPPSGPPPSYTPQQSYSASPYGVDPRAIRRCRFRYTYIWLRNGNSFWFYPTYVGRDSIAGYRWRNRRWVYYGTDLDRIRSFQCGGYY
jgi:hypothetical protein